jgi:hypothetical protein
MNWKPIGDAIKCNKIRVLARDADGTERVTWFEDGGWLYEGWRETEDRQEYASEEWWEPTEYAPDA